MVKRKRLSTATGCEETTTELNANGMIVDCGSPTKEGTNKKTSVISVNREQSCCNTRSKLKGTFETHQSKVLNEGLVVNSDESDALQSKQQVKLTITRSSSRTHRKPVRDASPLVQQSPRKSDKSPGKSSNLPEGKTRRSWELWSVDDKNAFFDALCEYGKDFESIQHFIAQKNKKKSNLPQMIKNKDQVRHFYYRTWHKISKYLDISEDVKKQTQELYGLINYGELRKKLGGFMDEKNGQKLNELVHNGATTIRLKGKNVRVKTPLCRALKRLNVVDDPKDDDHPKLPQKVTIELRPHNINSWTRVQSLAQNPRLRLTVSLQRRLATIIEFLQSKWRSHRLKTKEHLQTTLNEPIESKDDSEMNDVMRLIPSKESAVTLVTLRETTESATSASISLQNYRQNVVPKGLSETAAPSRKGTKPGSRTCVSDDVIKRVNCDDNATLPAELGLKLFSPKEPEKPVDGDAPVGDHEEALKLLLALTSPGSSTQTEKNEETAGGEVVQNDNESKEKAAEEASKVERFRQGWIVDECQGMTVGELFLQLGSPSKMLLEYAWETKKRSEETERTNESVLSKLVQFATLTFADVVTKNKNPNSECVPCRCGHVCPAPGMNSGKTNLIRNPVTARNAKNKCVPVKTQTILASSPEQPQFLVPRMTAPHSRTQFNRSTPTVMQHNKICDNTFKEQLDKLTHRKARGRVRKSVVVQRELLPKTNLAHSVMTLRIVPTTSQVGSYVPVLQPTVAISKDLKFTQTQVIANSLPITSTSFTVNASTSVVNSLPQISPASLNLSSLVSETITNDIVPTNNVAQANLNTNPNVLELSIPDHTAALSANNFSASPPSISLLDLPSCEVMQNENLSLPLEHADKLLDITLANSASSFSAFNLTTSNTSDMKGPSLPCLGVDSVPDCPSDPTTATNSPFKIVDSNWLSGETGDLSLSSLLGHLESSPLKNPITQALNIINEDHACGKLSSDVDNQLLCMLNENSVDYVAKFADLAAQISESPKKVTSPTEIQ